MKKVVVNPYNENWPSMFLEEAEKIKLIFGKELIEIYHIGSTSVPGLQAKPIIDMMPVVKNINVVDDFNQEMENLGYEPRDEFGIPGRRYFPKGGDYRTHHVHVFQVGSWDVLRHLAFRDYLREHPPDRKRYGDLKVKLAKQFSDNIDAYIDGKEQLVKEIEANALKWMKSKQ